MKWTTRMAVGATAVCLLTNTMWAQGQFNTRSLLEKKIFYVADGKVGTASFWSLYLGDHQCSIVKNFPGEGDVEVKANVNFNLLSSRYIEGKGYSNRGAITAEADLAVLDADVPRQIHLDSIDYVYGWGQMMKPIGTDAQEMVLQVQQRNQLRIRRLTLRQYALDKTTAELKHTTDIPIDAFSFTKEGAARAQAAQQQYTKETE